MTVANFFKLCFGTRESRLIEMLICVRNKKVKLAKLDDELCIKLQEIQNEGGLR